jgi:hypothetical protein
MSSEGNLDQLYPDISIRDMQWYWGVCPLTGLHQWFWVGPEVEQVADMLNYLSDEAPDTGKAWPMAWIGGSR